MVLAVSFPALSYEARDGLTAKYSKGKIRIAYTNHEKKIARIARDKGNYPIFDIEEAGWLGWKRIYPKGKSVRLKSGVDKVRPGKVKVYYFDYKLDKSKRYRIMIHGFGGAEIQFKN